MTRAILLLIVALVVLLGCPQKMHLTVTDVSESLSPKFCISERRGCQGDGIGMPMFSVAEVDDDGRWTNENGVIKPMWAIEVTENVKLRNVQYGQLPEGWKEISPSVPLELDTWYTAAEHYFRFHEDGGHVESEVLSHSQFWEQMQSASGTR